MIKEVKGLGYARLCNEVVIVFRMCQQANCSQQAFEVFLNMQPPCGMAVKSKVLAVTHK